MEGNVPHDFLQPGDVNYDDLINNSGWPVASGDQYAFTPAPPPQPNYHQYTTSQPSFDQYQQPSYATQYSTSPYTSQYQQPGVSPDAFGSSSYSVEPSLQNPAIYHGSTGSFSFAPQEAPTIAPQSLQYHVPPSQPMHPGVSSPTFQQPMNSYTPMAQEQQQVFFNNAQSAPPVPQPTPAQYPAVQGSSMDYAPKPAVKRSREGEALSKLPPQTKAEPIRSQPRITNPELYASNSAPPGPKFKHAPFMALGGPLVPVPSSMKVPKYSQRKSKLEQDPIPGFDISRILTPTLSSSSKIRPPKEKKILVSKYKGTAKPPGDRLTNVRGENGSLSTSVKDTLSPTDSSSSDEESSSEEESGGEGEEMALADISTVREPTRPAGIADAARWDAIGIVWKDPKSSPSADVIKGAIEDYGAFVGALRVQLKANSTKIEEVEKDSAEATRLRQARTALLDSLYETINAANTLGYGAIVENLGGHEKLVHGLTTTLIECIKADDFLGRLPKAIFTLLARFQTMTEALLKRLRFDSIQKRWSKKGDDQIKKDISSILANTTEAKERASKTSKDVTREEEAKKLQEKIELAKTRKLDAVKHAPNVTSTKRPHEGDPTTAKPNKKFALDTSANTTTAATKLAPPKKATNILANNLLGNTTKPAAKPLPKKREPSPPAESKLGALLASIAKPAEPPKAPEAPARPPETPEEKKRRERKESRRHLRVRFKDDSELEQIRLFKHELAEDEGRQDDMLRDAHDDRSEGMMHKKRVSEKLDENLEDDDALAGEIEERPYPNLVPIDFSELNKTTTFGSSYTTRGGDKTFSTPEQQIQERREALELMVIYTDPKDIPPSAKEPPQENRDIQPEAQLKRPNAPWIVNRLQEIDTYGPQYAAQIFFHRRAEARRVNDMQLASSQSGSSTNISSILQQLGGPKSSQKLLFSMDPSDLQNLTSIVEYLKSKPYPPTEPPQWMTNEAQRNDWWAGYRRDNTANGKQASTDLMAHMQVPRFEQRMLVPQMQQYHQQAPQPNMSSLPQATHDVAQQVQAYLSGLAASGNRGTSSHQPYDFSALVSGHGLGHDSGKDSQHSRWDGEWENEVSRNGKQRGNDTKQWGGTHDNDSLFDENGEYKGKKKPCKFWSQGKCAKGAKCTFLHDEED